MQQWTNTDKSEWPRGPWDDEPDKVQWIDEATDLDCLIVRNRRGNLCGYVGVAPDHPWHGKGYSECATGECDDVGWSYCEHSPVQATEVHGSLTYANSCDEDAPEGEGICHVPLPGRSGDMWWLGFDTAHSSDRCPSEPERRYINDGTYKGVPYVMAECASLAGQVLAVAS